VSELPSSEDLDPSTGTDAPTPPTTTGPSSYTLNWEEPINHVVLLTTSSRGQEKVWTSGLRIAWPYCVGYGAFDSA
jgi:hypothetical protein